MKIYKLLGKRGRLTIPQAIRDRYKLTADDLLSFEVRDDAIIIRREHPDKATANPRKTAARAAMKRAQQEESVHRVRTLKNFIDNIPAHEQEQIIQHLLLKYVAQKKGDGNG